MKKAKKASAGSSKLKAVRPGEKAGARRAAPARKAKVVPAATRAVRAKASDGAAGTAAEFERLLKKKAGSERYVLRLYVTGSTPKSSQAIANIRALCEAHLSGRYDLEVIDIYQQPTAAIGEQIIAAPTLVKRLPAPPRRMVGDLANADRVLVGLDLRRKDGDGKPERGPKWVEL